MEMTGDKQQRERNYIVKGAEAMFNKSKDLFDDAISKTNYDEAKPLVDMMDQTFGDIVDYANDGFPVEGELVAFVERTTRESKSKLAEETK